jgi:spore germination protein KB
MNKEVLSDRQIVPIIVMFLLGSLLLIDVEYFARQDSWIAVLLGAVAIVPIYLIFVRLAVLYPGMHLFEMTDEVFPPFVSRSITVLFSIYAYFTGAFVVRINSEFIHTVAFPETPPWASLIMMGLTIIYSSKLGMEVLGRWSQFFIYPVLLIPLTVSALAMTNANVNHLRPVLGSGFKPVMDEALLRIFYPFGEIIILMYALTFSNERNKPKRTFFIGLLIGCFMIVLIKVRNLLVLGPEMVEQLYFPSYNLVGLIEIGRFIQRIESSVTIAFFAVGFVKTTVCVIAALRGMQHIFRLDHYRSVTAPFCLLFIVLCENLFKNLAEVIEFINFYYPFIAVPFQLFLPVSLWIGAEVKHRKKNASENPAQPPPMPPYTETSS